MTPHEAAALGPIRAAYEEEVTYTGAGLTAAPIKATRSETGADAFQGAGSTAREVSFEVAQSALPQDPRKGNILVHGADRWKVNDITRRDDVAAFVLIVEEAPAP